jgi:hypothetical protein
MILTRVQGGLGNQLFQYAFGKMLALKNNTQLKIDTSLLTDNLKNENAVIRNFDLDIFETTINFASQSEISFYNGYPDGNILLRAFHKADKVFRKRNLLIQDKHLFNHEHLNATSNTCIVGRWQSEKYFEEKKEAIIADFKIKSSWLLNSTANETIANAAVPISIHVRREDYVKDKNGNVVRSGLVNGNLDVSYYLDAVNYFINLFPNAQFFVFSEDYNWCIQNLQFIPRAVFVKTEKNKKGMAEDLYLIGKCHHHITSHSTFSWWGAYLSSFDKKIIVAPKQWSFTTDDFTPPHIVPDSWVKI